MNPVTTEGTPSSITAPAAAAAGPPSPAKTFPVVASRANPPPTTGKLTENKIVIISQLFVGKIYCLKRIETFSLSADVYMI